MSAQLFLVELLHADADMMRKGGDGIAPLLTVCSSNSSRKSSPFRDSIVSRQRSSTADRSSRWCYRREGHECRAMCVRPAPIAGLALSAFTLRPLLYNARLIKSLRGPGTMACSDLSATCSPSVCWMLAVRVAPLTKEV